MYKIFHGFHLVEAYQDLKKAKRLAKNQTVARCIKLTVAITLSLILWLLPIDTFGIEGLTVIEQKFVQLRALSSSVLREQHLVLGRLGYGIWFAFYTNLKNRAWKCEASYQL